MWKLFCLNGTSGSQNELLCQLTAEAGDLPGYAGPVEAIALGDLLVRSMFQGFIPLIQEGRRMIKQ